MVTIDVHVLAGRVGIGCLDSSETAFVAERFVDGTRTRRVTLRVDAHGLSAVIVRNARSDGPSRFRITRAEACLRPQRAAPYPSNVLPRDLESEPVPERGGPIVFDDQAADAINAARMAFIRRLDLPMRGRRVLDVGAGVGHFCRLYESQGAVVVAVEGREDNVRELRRRFPRVEAHVGDVQEMDLTPLGRFDIVHCFGLLYHLDSPVAALRRLERVCGGVLLLETMVCDSARPLLVLADEMKAVNQALGGIGCRPSPSFVAMALNRVGFGWVYGAVSPPDHPDFTFEWKDSLDISRDGRNLRCVFVAAHTPVESSALVPIIES